ncbi:MAG: hypothetical protein ABII71_03380 [Candidatus Micrarchaeota archaeon]
MQKRKIRRKKKLDYVYRCKLSYEDKNDPGWNKIGVYMGLMGMGGITGCENAACPSWRRLQEAGEFDAPECGNAYLCPPGNAPEAPEGTIVDEGTDGE